MTECGPRPEVTVVISTHNRARRLEASLACALAQRDVAVEVVVVDDGSSDETASTLNRRADPRLRVVRHAAPEGVARARNAGLDAARAEWVAFLDDDDLWSPDKLRRQLDAATAADATFAYCGSVEIDDGGTPLATFDPPDPATLASGLRCASMIPAGASNVVARTRALRRLGGFDPRFRHLADWDLWIRLAADGPAAACPDPHVAYVRHAAAMRTGDADAALRELEQLDRKHDHGRVRSQARADVLRWAAVGHRAGSQRLAAAKLYLRAGAMSGSAGDFARAFGALLGEPAIRAAGRWAPSRARAPGQRPEWLRSLRVEG